MSQQPEESFDSLDLKRIFSNISASTTITAKSLYELQQKMYTFKYTTTLWPSAGHVGYNPSWHPIDPVECVQFLPHDQPRSWVFVDWQGTLLENDNDGFCIDYPNWIRTPQGSLARKAQRDEERKAWLEKLYEPARRTDRWPNTTF